MPRTVTATAPVVGARRPETRETGYSAAAAPAAAERDTPALPDIPDPSSVDTATAKELSRVLFVRLRALEEGTADYSYVRNSLVELNLGLVRFAASQFSHRHEPMEDIIQVGTVGLIKAINRFDPDRDVEFLTYALPTITGEIKRYFRDSSWAVHVPRRLQELRLRLAKAHDTLEQELNRAPTTRELADHLGLPEQEVVDGRVAANGYTAGTLETPGTADSDEDSPLERRVGVVDERFEQVEAVAALKPLMARLSARDRRILGLRFVDELTQSEIGERIGVSQMQVSRLLASALANLRQGLAEED
ncbi:SigB/SigF/SigG family RNA polymerase sigma factor [Streptacidiphilus jiangxiensis]|uniref:RNA polymerase sigma-B factor n=1 Tax=Streptacidiphilus jiangxiensis TaxID=235985 RepID=A0A1H7N3V5_STRJI|nr:SigB/SigF/SigG family RNA polymerase sigma factor [Streptacidiphilus jiangxiensis]SEL18316.1 RNA polymerase sigma-B factor [Streptacidiphilus jiangxiensis]